MMVSSSGVRVRIGSRIAAVAVFGIACALVALPGSARAVCTAGTEIGSCEPGISYEGCCIGPATVTWCEQDGSQCEIDCSTNANLPTNSCCSTSPTPGCCNVDIMACVCDIDSLCCDSDLLGWDSFCVDEAITYCGGCGGCTQPATKCGWDLDKGYYNCRPLVSADPTGTHPRACGGPVCTPACNGKECGADGCGGTCGSCGVNEVCSVGTCVSTCTPSCGGKQCGADGCGGTCGTCSGSEVCSGNGQCQPSVCVPECTGRNCGPDGCGGVCGTCTGGGVCTAGQCTSTCTAVCAGKECGDDGCGGTCGSCTAGKRCLDGQCAAACQANCTNKDCGDDGCGGSCGTCLETESCVDGECQSACTCEGKQCGSDGCGRVCGYCGPKTMCDAETQQCVPVSDTQPDAATDTSVAEPASCPAGQAWSSLAQACVIDPNAGAHSGGSSSAGCAGSGEGGAEAGIAWLAALGALLAARRLRRR